MKGKKRNRNNTLWIEIIRNYVFPLVFDEIEYDKPLSNYSALNAQTQRNERSGNSCSTFQDNCGPCEPHYCKRDAIMCKLFVSIIYDGT